MGWFLDPYWSFKRGESIESQIVMPWKKMKKKKERKANREIV
jgi:hypothetical protein